MNQFPNIELSDYHFDLPKEYIALRPSKKRGKSKLLIYNKGHIHHAMFENIKDTIPKKSTLFLNDTKVIPARLHFQRQTGAHIEIFLLDPISNGGAMELTMQSSKSCTWECMIGNVKKWKEREILMLHIPKWNMEVSAELINKKDAHVQLHWDSAHSFSELLAEIGNIPLPPYIQREVEESDYERYQTVYSKVEGAVAAPTAGLHFTEEILDALKEKKMDIEYLTLHVGAGTFQPISEGSIDQHPMHAEKIVISKKNILKIINSVFSIAVGTTSMRTLESIYWFGTKLHTNNKAAFFIEKDYPYKAKQISLVQSMKNILQYMSDNNLQSTRGVTEIFIVPGYQFKVVEGLITNYHLPGSTLILLVAAFIGSDWRNVYEEAMKNNYQFLSYGDSSFLMP